MTSSYRIGLAVGLAVSASAARAEPLDVKTGQWEGTTTIETSGAPPIDLSQLPPDRRARVEALMKQQEARGKRAHTHHTRHCLTREELSKNPFQDVSDSLGRHGETCERKVISSTSRRWQGKVTCTGEAAVTSELSIEAVSTSAVKGSVRTHASNGAHTMDTSSTFSARWVKATCDANGTQDRD